MATTKTLIVKGRALQEAQVKQLLSQFGSGSIVYSVEVPDDGAAVSSTEPIALKPAQIGLLVVPTEPGNDG